jgi:hypothetical protein
MTVGEEETQANVRLTLLLTGYPRPSTCRSPGDRLSIEKGKDRVCTGRRR